MFRYASIDMAKKILLESEDESEEDESVKNGISNSMLFEVFPYAPFEIRNDPKIVFELLEKDEPKNFKLLEHAGPEIWKSVYDYICRD